MNKITKYYFKVFFTFDLEKGITTHSVQGHDGRVVKALDSKSNGIFPHRFESCS